MSSKNCRCGFKKTRLRTRSWHAEMFANTWLSVTSSQSPEIGWIHLLDATQTNCAKWRVPPGSVAGRSSPLLSRTSQFVQDRPTELLLNLDEVGISEWEDRKSKNAIVQTSMRDQTRYHKINRKLEHVSIIVCVSEAVREQLKTRGVSFGTDFILKAQNHTSMPKSSVTISTECSWQSLPNYKVSMNVLMKMPSYWLITAWAMSMRRFSVFLEMPGSVL
jgi:hypothetical protein